MKLNKKMFTVIAFVFCGLIGNAFAHEHAEGEEMHDHDQSSCGCHVMMSQDETAVSTPVIEEKVETQDQQS